MRYVLLAFTIAACSRSQAPAAPVTEDTSSVVETVDAAAAATAVDAGAMVSPADTPSAVTP